ncbi:hypothetical protein D3C87_588190 [compost metagenome]
MQAPQINTGGRVYGETRRQTNEQRRIERMVTYMESVHSSLRFGAKRSIIAHTLGEGNPYEDFRDIADLCALEKNTKILDAFRSLTARIRRHAVNFLQLCETWEERFANEELAIKLIKTLEIMQKHDLPYETSDKLKRRLIVAKLAHVVDN